MTEISGWLGEFAISINGETTVVKNRVTDIALEELSKALRGETADIEIRYIAIGTSNAPLADNATQLGAEIFRAQVQSVTKTANAETTTIAVVLDTEAVGTIEEIGLFGGSDATGAANSGKLISRILWKHTKTANEEITFTRTDRMVRA